MGTIPSLSELNNVIASRELDKINNFLVRIDRMESALLRNHLQSLMYYVQGWLDLPAAQLVESLNTGLDIIDKSFRSDEDIEACIVQEKMIVLTGICGIQMQLRSGELVKTGRLYSGAMKKARSISMENPRLLLLEGLIEFKRPTLLGGGVNAAHKKFLRSVAQFKSNQKNNESIWNWGEAESLYWLANTELQLKKKDSARQTLERVFEICPLHKPALALVDELSIN